MVKVKPYEKISKKDEVGVLKLYETLVSKDCTRPIDVELIVTEGFPAFESTIGKKDFDRVKKYFGIGVKKPSKNIKEYDLRTLIGKLRTVENAMYYLSGYKKMLDDVASKLEGAPEDWTSLEKAKFVRMYMVIFVGYYYFAEDYVLNPFKKEYKEMVIDYSKALKNNQKSFGPEELFELYEHRIKPCPKENMVYESMIYTLSTIDNRTFKEVMHFAELKFDSNTGFKSVNSTIPNQTFNSVRAIKMKVFKEPGIFPLEAFFFKDMMHKQRLESLYSIYKLLKVIPLEEFEKMDMPYIILEGSKAVPKEHYGYRISGDLIISGEDEANRFIHLLDSICFKRYKLKSIDDNDTTEYDVSIYMAAINLLLVEEYIGYSTVKEDIEMARKVVEADKTHALEDYRDKKISVDDVKKRIGIDSHFESEVLGIKKKLTSDEIVTGFAAELGYVDSMERVDKGVIQNVLVPGNESKLKELSGGSTTRARFEKALDLDSESAEMFFDLSKVYISAIETKLLELKKRMVSEKMMQKHKSLIKLYCYLIENEIPCGSKYKVPKRNKGLKPTNLKKFI